MTTSLMRGVVLGLSIATCIGFPWVSEAACPQASPLLLSTMPTMIVLFGGGTAPLSIPNSHVDGIDALYIADPHGHNVCGYVAYVNVSGVGWNQSGYSYYNPHLSPPPIYPQHYQFGTDGLMGGEINAEKPDPEHLGTYLALGVDNIKPVSLPQIGS